MEEILHQLIDIVYPIISKVLYIPGGYPDFWTINSIALPKFNIAPETWWLGDKPFLLGPSNFSGDMSNFGGGTFCILVGKDMIQKAQAQWLLAERKIP